jgi:hypothetical protein
MIDVIVLSDSLVKNALALKKYKGVKYNTVAQRITGLIPPGSDGINHRAWTKLSFIRVTCVHRAHIGIPTDGVVVLLTVKIVK